MTKTKCKKLRQSVRQKPRSGRVVRRGVSRETSVPNIVVPNIVVPRTCISHPTRIFHLGELLSCPIAVCESQVARIVGFEWNWQTSTWDYWLVEGRYTFQAFDPKVGIGSPWKAGEAELTGWVKGN